MSSENLDQILGHSRTHVSFQRVFRVAIFFSKILFTVSFITGKSDLHARMFSVQSFCPSHQLIPYLNMPVNKNSLILYEHPVIT